MISLDDQGKIKETDKGGMLGVVCSMPGMLKEALLLSGMTAVMPEKEIENIVVAGMGGSATAGDLISDLFRDQLPYPLIVNRNYTFSKYVNRKSLVFISSYSGDTEETLSCFREAEKAQAEMVCIASGGKLKELAEGKKLPLYEVKAGLQPRAALPYSFVAIGTFLEKSGMISGFASQVVEVMGILEGLRLNFGPDVPERQNPIKQMAKKLQGKVPIIFASAGTTEAIGRRLKNQLNENAKMNAHLAVFPELNHNELVSLSQLKRGEHEFAAVFLRDEEDHARVNKRIDITRSTLSVKMGGALEIPSSGKCRMCRMFSQIFFIDLLTVYLGILDGIDPTPVETISKFKKEMTR